MTTKVVETSLMKEVLEVLKKVKGNADSVIFIPWNITNGLTEAKVTYEVSDLAYVFNTLLRDKTIKFVYTMNDGENNLVPAFEYPIEPTS